HERPVSAPEHDKEEREVHQGEAGPEALGHPGHLDREARLWQEALAAQPQASASSSRVSASSCGRVLVAPTTVMKLASPDQRGTTCWCRWSARDPPATPPRLSPTLKACGPLTSFSTRMACWVVVMSSEASSPVRSSSSAT